MHECSIFTIWRTWKNMTWPRAPWKTSSVERHGPPCFTEMFQFRLILLLSSPHEVMIRLMLSYSTHPVLFESCNRRWHPESCTAGSGCSRFPTCTAGEHNHTVGRAAHEKKRWNSKRPNWYMHGIVGSYSPPQMGG